MQILNIVLLLVVIISSIIIFPIFFNLDLCFISHDKKLYFKIKILWLVRLVKGYCELIDEGIIIHLNKFKAIIIPYNKLFGMRKKVKPLKDYHFIKFNSVFEIGDKDDLILSLSNAFIYNYIMQYITWFFYHEKPYVDFDARTIVIEDESVLNIYCSVNIVFNLLMVIISLIKMLVEKIIYAVKSKAKQN